MIDYNTFRKLHPGNFDHVLQTNQQSDRMSKEDMAKDEPPDERFVYLLPLQIKGYNLRRKYAFISYMQIKLLYCYLLCTRSSLATVSNIHPVRFVLTFD
jgi:hypothetical protein